MALIIPLRVIPLQAQGHTEAIPQEVIAHIHLQVIIIPHRVLIHQAIVPTLPPLLLHIQLLRKENKRGDLPG
jgi:hypothetical protein